MVAETEYRDETQAPTREEIDRGTGAVLLEFGTPSCAFCRALAPKVAELLDRSPEVRHVKVGTAPDVPSGAPSRSASGRASCSSATDVSSDSSRAPATTSSRRPSGSSWASASQLRPTTVMSTLRAWPSAGCHCTRIGLWYWPRTRQGRPRASS